MIPLGGVFAVFATLITLIVIRSRRAGRALREAFDAQAAAQETLEYMARHDVLTGLPNRALFLEHLDTAIAHAGRGGGDFAVHYLDLDGFKEVNDTFGHAAGDELLRQVAARLENDARSADTVARFGGDEFAILQRDAGDRQAAALLAGRIVATLEEPYDEVGDGARIRVSVGVAFSTDGVDSERLLVRADRALYRAKGAGGNGFMFYDPDVDGLT